MIKILLTVLAICMIFPLHAVPELEVAKSVDICVYGGTSLGVVAAYTAKKQGKSVLLIEPTTHVGGMSSGGLGMTDIGNKYVVKGIALDFYRRLGSYYGSLEKWVFEPKVAEKIFCRWKIVYFVSLTTIYSKSALMESQNMLSKKVFSTGLPVEMWKKP